MALPLVGLAARIIAKNKSARKALSNFMKSKKTKAGAAGAVSSGAGFVAGRASAPKPKKPTMSAYERRMRETHKQYGIKAKIGRGQK